MTKDLNDLSNESLLDLRQQCSETIDAVLVRLEGDASLQASVRRLLQADDIRVEFERIDNSELVLGCSVAVLVNTQSVRAITSELIRRAVERN